MIGEKHQSALLGFVPDFDATQKQIVVPTAGRFIKEDDLVAPNRIVFGNGTAVGDAVIGVVLQGRCPEPKKGHTEEQIVAVLRPPLPLRPYPVSTWAERTENFSPLIEALECAKTAGNEAKCISTAQKL